MHFISDKFNWKLQADVLFTIYLQTLGDFNEKDSFYFNKSMSDFRNLHRIII